VSAPIFFIADSNCKLALNALKCFLSSYMSLHMFRCVVSGLQALHKAKYGHTDIRWQNLIQCGHVYCLIDLEFACKLNQEPFTPQG